MQDNRRGFLKRASQAAIGVGCGFPLLASIGCGCGECVAEPSLTQWAMVVDLEKCLMKEVRDACSEACHRAHNVPSIENPMHEVKWIWSEKYKDVFPDQAHQRIDESLAEAPVLVLCNHCTKPSCVKVCPTQATWKRESDGVVMMDMHRCIGCRYCIAACPYGARSFNWSDAEESAYLEDVDYPKRSKGVVEKCTFCAERIREGLDPVCVEAAAEVPGGEGALTFGDVTDPDSKVSKLLREKHTICRRVALGTGPNVYYIVSDELRLR